MVLELPTPINNFLLQILNYWSIQNGGDLFYYHFIIKKNKRALLIFLKRLKGDTLITFIETQLTDSSLAVIPEDKFLPLATTEKQEGFTKQTNASKHKHRRDSYAFRNKYKINFFLQ